jgi:FtsP/CotA-like multicopper oxidase with cupredoxin domain
MKVHRHEHDVAPDSSRATGAAGDEYTRAFESAQPDEGRSVVRVDLEAREVDWEFVPGKRTRAWAFGGQVPGPTIEAQVGAVLEIRLINHLPEPTVVHWHGLRIPAVMDGTARVQRPVAPGETFIYRFRVPDAGTFWYHSHFNETVQLERGLYGALIVRAPDEPVFDADRTFVLDDVALERDGEIKPPGWWIESHDGREGNIRLVNGRQEPEIRMAAGQIERWRFVNAASARYVRLSVGGRPFRIIGSGGGLIPSPVTATDVLLCTADRTEIAVGPFAEGETLRIETLPFNRGSFKAHKKPELFATLKVGAAAPSRTRLPDRLRDIAPLVTGPVTPDREVRLGFSLGMTHGVEFNINREQHHHAEPVRVGALQVWDVLNRSPVHHPFHLHGFFFQVLEVNGKARGHLSWEDTVNVPAFGSVRIAWTADDRPGEWMYHCHILEHHAAGMMAHFEVIR